MSTRQVFCLILSMCLFLSFGIPKTAESVSADTAMTKAQAQEQDDLIELMNQIRREKFDLILPQVMREQNIDMWIQVMREGLSDPFGAALGSNSGVFIFTDRGGDRIERAVLGLTSDLVRECGAYDITPKKVYRRQMPAGPETELDLRFKGLRKFVAKRDPKRIGVNYLEKLGTDVLQQLPRTRSEGISHTDYNLLVKALGDKYAKRIVSAEYLLVHYLSRPVKSEIVMFKKIRTWIGESLERDISKIVPGVTQLRDLRGVRSVSNKGGNRRRGDYVIQRGDLIKLGGGKQSGYMDLNKFSRERDQVGVLDFSKWKFGSFYEVVDAYAYVLREGETEPPPKIKRTWADALKVRKVFEDNIKLGGTAGDTFEILKRKVEEAGFIYVNRQIYNKDLDLEKTQVPIDLHAAQGMYPPRISPLGAEWQWDITLPPNHHFYMEYWIYVPMPEWGEGRYLNLRFHDGAILTERGVEYPFPPPTELHLIR